VSDSLDVTVAAAPCLAVVNEIHTLQGAAQMVLDRIVALQRELEANLSELRTQGRVGEIRLVERTIEVLGLELPVVGAS